MLVEDRDRSWGGQRRRHRVLLRRKEPGPSLEEPGQGSDVLRARLAFAATVAAPARDCRAWRSSEWDRAGRRLDRQNDKTRDGEAARALAF
jgi:hypothetical protein